MSRSKRGFTLIEALVSAVLLAFGVTAVMLALGGQMRTEANVRRREVLLGLVRAKMDELAATTSTNTSTDGDFGDQGFAGVTWGSSYEDTGIENVQALTVTVTDSADAQTELRESTLIYTPPVTTTTGAAQ
ncbi:type II secretion system protein [bacterium]|nr:MAG: type II secretion system protein [bacterium]